MRGFWPLRINSLAISIVVHTFKMSKPTSHKSVTPNSGVVPWKTYEFDFDALRVYADCLFGNFKTS